MCISGILETLAFIGLIILVFAIICGFQKLIDWLLASNLIGKIVGVAIIIAWAAITIIGLFMLASAGKPNDWILLGYSTVLCLSIFFSFGLDSSPFKTGAIVGAVALLLLGGLVSYGHWANIYCGTDCGFLTEWGHFVYANTRPIV
jgi:hypothetical protein